ncbi:MAG: (2Fe-2S)-binding protein [Candidatus Bathyarchaeia archaeon]
MVRLTVNQVSYDVPASSSEILAEVLRNKLGLTGTKISCYQGDCGACTVIVDHKPVLSCLMLIGKAEGKNIQTVEGLAEDGELHPIQLAFIENFGTQCGYCEPGMLMAAKALLDRNQNPSDLEIRQALSGNLCRCGSYRGAVKSVQAAAGIIESRRRLSFAELERD